MIWPNPKHRVFRAIQLAAALVVTVFVVGLALPERLIIPVSGATAADWNHRTFWHAPWGASGVHRGIDIFAANGTPVLSATPGPVLFQGRLGRGGTVVMVLGPKWRLHYYAHLQSAAVGFGQWVSRGQVVGGVGTTGNAKGKPPHLHYSIVTPLPYPWLYESGAYGWQRMIFLNPHERLLPRGNHARLAEY